uniref:hypothetical protein n=1 Tax=Micromonospora sp. NBC_00855 TaxID=2975978 RepID=UPI002255D5F7|nr:hypothetical protein OHB51_35460 [Micromonospora sp. NBC_00855]
MTPEQADELAEFARTTATSLVARVHTERPEVIWAHLDGLDLPHLIATTVVLAAMVPLAAAPDELLAWIESEPSAGVLHESRPRIPEPTDRSLDPMDANVPKPDPVAVEVVPDDTARAAHRVVAAHAADAAECEMLLAMLGLDGKAAA